MTKNLPIHAHVNAKQRKPRIENNASELKTSAQPNPFSIKTKKQQQQQHIVCSIRAALQRCCVRFFLLYS